MTKQWIPEARLVTLDYYPTTIKNKKVFIPKFLTPKLAYYVGYLQGDGCLESNLKRIDFTDDNLDQMNLINDINIELFGVSGNIRRRFPVLSKKVVYTLEIGSVDIHKFLRNVFKICVGVKKDLSIPSMIKGCDSALVWYLRGLFDADGTLPKDAFAVKQSFVDITLKDKSFIEEIREALLTFNVITLNPYRRLAKSPNSDYISETWELRMRKRADIIRFINEVGFFGEHKAKRASLLLNRLDAAVAQPGYVRH